LVFFLQFVLVNLNSVESSYGLAELPNARYW